MLPSVRRNTECSQGADSDVLAQLLPIIVTVKFTYPSLLESLGVGLFWVSLCSLWWQASTPIRGCEFVLSPSMVVKSSFSERCTRIALMSSAVFGFPTLRCGPPCLHIKKRLWTILSDDQVAKTGAYSPSSRTVGSALCRSWLLKRDSYLVHLNLGVLFDKSVYLAWHSHSGESHLRCLCWQCSSCLCHIFCICFLYKGLIILLDSCMYSLTSINMHDYAFKVNSK